MRVPRRIAVATKLTLVCVLLAAALAQASEFRRTPAGDGLATTARTPHFTVRGKVKGLYPGSSKPLKLRLTNPNDAPISVKLVTVKARSTTVSCPSSAVKATKFKGNRRIGAHRTAKIKVKIRMKATTPDACQGAKFRLIYGGKAVGR
ncbi:MAG: hypothetical protein WBM72_03245 [Actinomycetota bacterium]